MGATGTDDVVAALRWATATRTPGDEEDRARAWTPEVYERLRQDKAKYDPANLLRYGHTVL
ncbi:BBE domain-containing protein [Streptomyces sp. NPDC058914]|uniref:BBE domain-containing protein n=1 Tax=Streptomyces sp. NPDC058914 TaxID=3346671 RepID=UPI00368AC94A